MRTMKYLAVVLIGLAALLIATPVYANDNVLDKAMDWCATVGKSDMDKDVILAKRRAQRTAKHARKAAQKSGKHLKKDLGR
jgi:hypothetical protein